jgi:hypothetical protein
LGTGAIVFAHRLVTAPDGIRLFGDYDSFDMSFYAAWASEATHTVPPMASFYSGHELNGAYYPQLVLAMTQRFAAVPLLSVYFLFAWPTFLALGGLVAHVRPRAGFCGHRASGGDLDHRAGHLTPGAWYLPHATDQWDYVLWPTNFLAPTMEVLHFNTWGPTLPVFFMFLYSVARAARTRSRGWIVAGAALLAVLFEFKPFAYIVAMAGLARPRYFPTRCRGQTSVPPYDRSRRIVHAAVGPGTHEPRRSPFTTAVGFLRSASAHAHQAGPRGCV